MTFVNKHRPDLVAETPPEAAQRVSIPDPALDAQDQVIDQRAFRDLLGCFTTGVVVVTSIGERGGPVGLTVNSFNSLSLEPPLILWSISLRAPSLSAFRSYGYFAVNILSAEQRDLCRRFATPAEDKFAGVEYGRGLGNVPIISNSVGHLECQAWARYSGGDHEIHVGRVLRLHRSERAPLVYHRGAFRQLAPADT